MKVSQTDVRSLVLGALGSLLSSNFQPVQKVNKMQMQHPMQLICYVEYVG